MRLCKAVNPDDFNWQYQHEIADLFFQQMADSTEQILRALQKEIDIEAVEEALRQNKPAIVIDSVTWSEALENPLAANFEPVYDMITAMTGAEAWAELKIPIRFDIRNPYSERWIAEHAAELVTQVTDETKKAIRGVVLDGFTSGYPPREMAVKIRDLVGLTERDARAALNYWERLSQEADLSAARVDAMVDTYERQMLRRRALVIARNETITASNQGAYASWKVAQDDGYLLPETKRVWIAAEKSDRTCPICMDFHGQEAGMNEEFVSKSGKHRRMFPTAHIQCRCAQGLITR